jgi:hypothetical protein
VGSTPLSSPAGWYGGSFKVTGITTLNGVPYPARVYLFPQDAPSLCIASAHTSSTGVFTFDKLRAGNYIALAIDPLGAWDAVIHNLVAAVGM